jgi:hypothetical protein
MDEGRRGACVLQEECTCSHRGKIFNAHDIVIRSSKKWYEQNDNRLSIHMFLSSQCTNGAWVCHDQPTSSRTCSIVGLTHVETFDGAIMSVKPAHYLLAEVRGNQLKICQSREAMCARLVPRLSCGHSVLFYQQSS